MAPTHIGGRRTTLPPLTYELPSATLLKTTPSLAHKKTPSSDGAVDPFLSFFSPSQPTAWPITAAPPLGSPSFFFDLRAPLNEGFSSPLGEVIANRSQGNAPSPITPLHAPLHHAHLLGFSPLSSRALGLPPLTYCGPLQPHFALPVTHPWLPFTQAKTLLESKRTGRNSSWRQ